MSLLIGAVAAGGSVIGSYDPSPQHDGTTCHHSEVAHLVDPTFGHCPQHLGQASPHVRLYILSCLSSPRPWIGVFAAPQAEQRRAECESESAGWDGEVA